MLLSRLFLPLLLACSLLLAQQAGAAHTVNHALAEQQQNDKQTPHSHNCELCALDAQFGSALNTGFITFALSRMPAGIWTQNDTAFLHAQPLPATARGPPTQLQ